MAAAERRRAFKFGWYGDNGLGEALIEKILTGEKTATLCPCYDPKEADEGELLDVVDKDGKARAKVRVVRIETRRFGELDEDLARKVGSNLEDIRRITSYANSRQLGDEEEMRATYFELIKIL